MTKLRAACVFLDYVLDMVVEKYQAKGANPAVAVIGYGTGPSGEPSYKSLLPGTNEEVYWVDAEALAATPGRARRKGPRRWISAEPSGNARSAAALVLAHRVIRNRLVTHPSAGPPLLIHCHDGHSDDEFPSHLVASLRALASPSGEAQLGLMSCIFHEALQPSLESSGAVAPWEDLWAACSEVGGPGGSRKAFYVNMWPRRALHHLLALPGPMAQQAAPLLLSATHDAPKTRALKLPKGGNRLDQWEDAYAEDLSRGVAAVCDGAGEGVFVKTWAAILARRFVDEVPDVTDPTARQAWIMACRQEWRAEINYPDGLNWSQKRKVDEVGGAATFLGLRLAPDGAGGGDGAIEWRAFAVGDACLFLIRENRLLVSFPAVAAPDFGRAPALLRTLSVYPIPVPNAAAGLCRPGDLFVLVTDAIGQSLFRMREEGAAVDWERYWTIEPDEWAAEVEDLRVRRAIVNDDCTLLLIRVPEHLGEDGPG